MLRVFPPTVVLSVGGCTEVVGPNGETNIEGEGGVFGENNDGNILVADVVGELIDAPPDPGIESINVTYAKVRVVNPMSPYATIGIGSAEYETLVVGLKSDENGLIIYPAISSWLYIIEIFHIKITYKIDSFFFEKRTCIQQEQ